MGAYAVPLAIVGSTLLSSYLQPKPSGLAGGVSPPPMIPSMPIGSAGGSIMPGGAGGQSDPGVQTLLSMMNRGRDFGMPSLPPNVGPGGTPPFVAYGREYNQPPWGQPQWGSPGLG